jgi:hypothetical protein
MASVLGPASWTYNRFFFSKPSRKLLLREWRQTHKEADSLGGSCSADTGL